MSSSVAAFTNVSVEKCSFCSEEILPDARKCKHCGEFVKQTISKRVLSIFAAGVVIACVLAGMQPSSEGVLLVGVWAIFALSFARMFSRA
jgi:hypothetical protein